MKKILVPTDFSLNADKAVSFAVELAKIANAEIVLVNISSLLDAPFREITILEKKYNLPPVEAAQAELAIIKKELEESSGIIIHTYVYAGGIAASILLAAEENNADLIIMGTLGDAAFKEKLFGSITASVIGKTSIPVLAVPLLSEWVELKNILLAVNHFEEDPGLANPAIELASLFNATVFTAVFTDEDTAMAVDYIENSTAVNEYEEKLQSMYKDTKIEPEKLVGHTFEDTIDSFIKEKNIDLLVMFTHKRSLVGSLFNRSMTKKMSYHTNIPLLAVPVN